MSSDTAMAIPTVTVTVLVMNLASATVKEFRPGRRRC